MATRTNSALEKVLLSSGYDERAKQAAAWELENRGIFTNYQPKIQFQKATTNWFNEPQSPERIRYYGNRLLIFGVTVLLICLFYFLPDLLTLERNLIPLTGTVNSSNVYIDNVQDHRGYKSKRARLIIYLNEYRKKFELSENIGQDRAHKNYNKLAKGLKNAKQVTIWIRHSEKNSLYPKVFKIEADNNVLLSFSEVRTENGSIFIYLIMLGSGSILLVLYRRYIKN